jgi:acyl-CoA synthetase (AMP-forming)/AMP-acid ligase II
MSMHFEADRGGAVRVDGGRIAIPVDCGPRAVCDGRLDGLRTPRDRGNAAPIELPDPPAMVFDTKQFAHNVAFLLEDGSRVTYAQLEERIGQFQQNFRVGRGLLLLEADNSLGTMVAYLAALRSNCPVALVEPGKSEAVRSRFAVRYHYAGPSDHFAVLSSADGAAQCHPSLALVLSTSGSTGTAKYVCLSYDNIVSNARSVAQYLELTARDRAPTNLPFFYSYGLSVVNSHLMVGASIVLTNMSVVDAPFWQLFDRLECTGFAGVPYTYEVLQKTDFVSAERKSLRYCTQAGGKLSRALVLDNAERARKEGWKFYVMYGQTEASPRMAYLPADMVLEHPECIGVAIPGGRFRLEDQSGSTIDEPDTPGELVYSGPNVMMGYAHGQSDLANPVGDSELRTGDMACRNRAGLYYIVGRKSRFLKMFGLRVSLDAVEDFLSKGGVKAACGGVDGSLRILAVGNADVGQIERSVAAWLGVPPFAVQAFHSDELPVQANGKVDYQRVNGLLEVEHRRRENSAPSEGPAASDGGLSAGEQKLLAIFAKATGQPLSDPSVTLRNAGADSLSVVQIRLELDRLIAQVPDNWMDLSVRDLASRFAEDEAPAAKRLLAMKSLDAFIVFRALAIIFVVAHHFSWFFVPGGSTTLLFVIGGYLFYETAGEVLLAGGRTSSLWNGLVIVVTTLLVASVVQAAAHTYVGTNWHITLLLPYENLSSYINDRFNVRDTQHHVHWLWFIHAYIQVFALLALALSSAKVRGFFAERTHTKVLVCFVFAELLAMGLILADSTRRDLGHSAALLQYAPTTILPVVLFGVLIALTKTPRQYAGTVVAGLSYVALYAAGVFTQGGLMTLIVIVLILFVRTMKVPSFSLRPILLVSEASLFIYLIHMPFQFAIERLLHWDVSPALLTAAAIAVSVGLWQVWKALMIDKIRRLAPQRSLVPARQM